MFMAVATVFQTLNTLSKNNFSPWLFMLEDSVAFF